MNTILRYRMVGGLLSLLFLLQPFGLLMPSSAQAAEVVADQGGLHIIVSPSPLDVVVVPGKVVTTNLRVKNAGSQSEHLMVSVRKFTAQGDEGRSLLQDPAVGDSFIDWVSFSEKDFVVEAGQWKTISATINVPITAAFGYYYAVVFSRVNNPVATGAGQTTTIGGAAILILLNVKAPGEKPELNLLDFSTDSQFYEYLPVTFTTKVRNTGNIHVAPRGTIFIDRGDTHDVGLLSVNPQLGNILPNSGRTFITKWDDGFPVYQDDQQNGKTVGKSLKWDFSQISKLRIGKYTAHLLLVYDNGNTDTPLEATVSYWVIPWRILLVLLLIILILLVGLWRVGRGFYQLARRGQRRFTYPKVTARK